jgi:hypothetical protein
LATRFQRRRFLLEITRNKNCLWSPCLLTNLDDMNQSLVGSIYGRSSIKSVHFVPID